MTATHWTAAALNAYAAVTAAGPPAPADHPDDVAPAGLQTADVVHWSVPGEWRCVPECRACAVAEGRAA